jgi:DNA-binding MarR family transcriptional regulator
MSGKKPLCKISPADPEDPSHLLRQLFMALRVQTEEGLKPRGFSLPQFGVMMFLKRMPGLSNAELARRAYVTPQAMGEVLSTLEKAKLIRRRPHEGNARILSAELTPSGEKALDSCLQVTRQISDRMFAPMSAENKKVFAALLEQCLTGLNAGAGKHNTK